MRVLVIAALAAVAALLPSQDEESPLLRRWVGTHYNVPLHFDFYGDSMLVVNDLYPLTYEIYRDSILAYGDTAFSVSYWFARDHLLLQTEEGRIITMTEQDKLARPLHNGRWRGGQIGMVDDMELGIFRGGGARWRNIPEGDWIEGEGDRATRIITFTWFYPDTTEVEEGVDVEAAIDTVQWVAQYDPEGSALLFPETIPELGTVVLRKAFRW